MPIGILGLSNAARSGLTGFVAGLARGGLAENNVTINNLLPGAFATDRLRKVTASSAQAQGTDFETARERWIGGIPGRRFGSIEEFGAACAFLCSAHAGYVTGQNILMDGGAYPGTF